VGELADTHGAEALQALVAQKDAQWADKAMYVCLGALTEQAAKFARERGVRWGCTENFVNYYTCAQYPH
jgi:restriction system protein